MARVSAKEIAEFLSSCGGSSEGRKARISGNTERSAAEIAKLLPGKLGALSFCKYEDANTAGMIWSSASSVIICSAKLTLEPPLEGKTLIYVPKPRLAFSKTANKFFMKGITVCAAKIALTTKIGPNCIFSGDIEIGDNSILYGNVSIFGNVKIGKNVIINAGAVIGAEGFGYEPDEDGTLVQFPQIGGVIIEDNVEIGANTCIDRGALGDTIIREGAKIDNMVHVAHNVVIGKNCRIICLVGIGGSVEIGDGSFVGISASIKNQKKIGKNVVVGMGAVVTKDVPDNATIIGNPARPM